MTPDLSTPEGRAEMRALLLDATLLPWSYDEENHDDVQRPYRYGPQVVYSLGDCDIHPVADCSCNHTCRDEAEAAANGKLIAGAVNALGPLLDILDAAYAAFEGRAGPNTLAEMRERMVNEPEYRADFWRRAAADMRATCHQVVDDLQAKFDAAHATIERLTAPVTEGEGGRTADLYMNGRKPMREVLDAFIARRKDPTP